MSIREQKEQVERLSGLARAKRKEAGEHRLALRRWRYRIFGGTKSLAWSFAAGAWFAAKRKPDPTQSTVKRTAVTAANASFFLWRALGRPPAPGE